MTLRSDIRHTCFRMKNGKLPSPDKAYIIDLIEASKPAWATWDNFADAWDVFVDQHGQVKIIRPESDYEYAHSACLEAAIYAKKNMEWDFDDRALNVLFIVELNMLGNMDWKDYNKTWGIYVDSELKRIHTKHFLTKANVVTSEMIQNSIKSDGAAMTSVPELSTVTLSDFSAADMTPEERAIFERFSKKTVLH
jgi:hypothetical protein